MIKVRSLVIIVVLLIATQATAIGFENEPPIKTEQKMIVITEQSKQRAVSRRILFESIEHQRVNFKKSISDECASCQYDNRGFINIRQSGNGEQKVGLDVR